MTKFFNKFKKPFFGTFLVHFHNIFGKKNFLQNPALSHKTSYGFLARCQNLEKINDKGRSDRPSFIGAFQLPPGVQKFKNAV